MRSLLVSCQKYISSLLNAINTCCAQERDRRTCVQQVRGPPRSQPRMDTFLQTMESYLVQLEDQQAKFFAKYPDMGYSPFTEMELHDVARDCANEKYWKLLEGTQIEVNVKAGQLRSVSYNRPHKPLVGSVGTPHFTTSIGLRSHAVLLSCKGPKPTPKHTADHVNSARPFDDRAGNLRWATAVEQVTNRRGWVKNDRRSNTPVECSDYSDFRSIKSTFPDSKAAILALDIPLGSMKRVLVNHTPHRGLYWRYKPLIIEDEVWRPIKYVGMKVLLDGYEISSAGRVRYSGNVSRISRVPSFGSVAKTQGYMKINMCLEEVDGTSHMNILVHSLVCLAFHGKPKGVFYGGSGLSRVFC